MEDFVETGGLILPSADLLVKQIVQIEHTLPGWWWSLSFSETNICLTMGPDKNVPDPEHLRWMHTKEGDFGLSHTTYTHAGERKTILPCVISTTLQRVLEKLHHVGVCGRLSSFVDTGFVAHGEVKYRHHNASDLENVKTQYQSFLDQLDFIKTSEFIIREFYIGLCGLTVDCSIRGGDDEHEFDCTADLHEGNIGDSIKIALGDLLQDINATYFPNTPAFATA